MRTPSPLSALVERTACAPRAHAPRHGNTRDESSALCAPTVVHRTTSLVGASRRAHARSGVALVMFALLVFAFMGIAAVTIDMGIASLTQAQMQNAADTASLEGVRLRDFAGYRSTSDPLRRPHVSELVQMVFDDNLHPTSGVVGTLQNSGHGGISAMGPDDPDLLHFGVGPGWSVTGGGAGNVGAKLDSSNSDTDVAAQIDDPVLRFNTGNLPNGDMLSGKYDPFALTHTDAPGGYVRDDFATPPDIFESRNSIGFMVRMRRTNGGGGVDNQPGVSSGGPTLPFVFGLGSMIQGGQAGAFDPRTEGLTVRAVAIAAGRPAMAIGKPPNMLDRIGNPVLGMGYWYTPTGSTVQQISPPLALSLNYWTIALDLHTPVTLTVSGNKLLDSNNIAVGTFLASGQGGCVGQAVVGVPPAIDIPPDGVQRATFFPIYTSISNDAGVSTDRIVGFGYGDVVFFAPADGSPPVWSVQKGFTTLDGSFPVCAVWVAPDNVSAHLSSQAPALSVTEWDSVFAAYNHFGYPLYDPDSVPPHLISFDWQDIRPGTVLAPALVR